jgi:hypothetical protein
MVETSDYRGQKIEQEDFFTQHIYKYSKMRNINV